MINNTNSVEDYHRQLRKVTESKGVFRTSQAARKLFFLAHREILKKMNHAHLQLATHPQPVSHPLRRPDAHLMSSRFTQLSWYTQVYIHSPEDLILYKLMYFRMSQQSKHSRVIAAILEAKKNRLNLVYSQQGIAQLGLRALWKEMFDSNS